MQRGADGSLVFSPSDLVTFLRSPFATWMDRLRVEMPDGEAPDAEEDEDRLIAEMGIRHERAWLEGLRAEGRDIVEIQSGGRAPDFAGTRAAIESGREVIYQAALELDGFAGYADFLERTGGGPGGWRYEVLDTKLARSPKPHFIVQLCAYSEMLEAVQGARPESIHVVLGSGERKTFRTDDYVFAYRAVKRAFLAFVGAFDPSRRPDPDPKDDHGRWSGVVERWVEENDHLSRVANMTRLQIERLQAAGIASVAALAAADGPPIPRFGDGVFDRLRAQARLQRASPPEGAPAYELVAADPDEPRRGLALLPPPSPGDVWADFEGYPLVEGGLEYLFGAVTLEEGRRAFHDWWGHDAAGEKLALEQFVDFLHERRRRDPGMHVYHYGGYEVGALRRLMGKYATRETEVDDLLRGDVFVDLLTVVRQSVRVGTPGYSLKHVERLFRPARTGDVATGGESIVAYHAFREGGGLGDWRTSPELGRIRAYNEEDCESTWMLADWLWARQRESGIAWIPGRRVGAGEDAPDGVPEQQRENAVLAADLLREIPQDAAVRARDPDRWRIQEMLGWLLEYHRREAKPVWWERFQLRDMTHEELADEISCLGNLRREPGPPTILSRSKGWWYAFDPDQETKLEEDALCLFSEDFELKGTIETLDRKHGRVLVKIGPTFFPRLPGGQPPDVLSLIPGDRIPHRVLEDSIRAVATAWRESQRIPGHLEDVLLRRCPRIEGHEGGALLRPGEEPCDGAVQIAPRLAGTTLCIQGPPGTGKTRTAAKMILELLALGKRVGVTSNNHVAIQHLLAKCCKLHGGDLACIKVGGRDPGELREASRGAKHRTPNEAVEADCRLVGGTPWFFAREDVAGTFDVLFVDEAGQFSLANLVAVSRSCRNFVLVGDQLQLAQPVQGSHPGDSGRSALDHVLDGQATIREEFGIFLRESWRLHPRICEFLSGTIYHNRLAARAANRRRVVRVPAARPGSVPVEAGLLFVPVEHEGNVQASQEEAQAIQCLLADLIGRERTDDEGNVVGRVDPSDVVVVAPYNMQVRLLERTLRPSPRIGSVDKFQGQEAAIVIVSMCASDGDSSKRGIEFLLDRNRLNVAISRAMSLAIVVGSPELARSRCATIPQIALVNTFCRIMEEGT